MNICWIPTTFSAEIRFNESFKCTKFKLDRSTHLYFMADFAKCVKRRCMQTKKNPKLWQLVSWKWLGRFSSCFICNSPTTWALLYQMWFELDKTSRSYICVKIAFSSYTHGVACRLLGSYNTIPWVLIYSYTVGDYIPVISKTQDVLSTMALLIIHLCLL